MHKANFDQEKKHRQHSIIKLAEQIQRSKAKDAEVEQLEAQVKQLYSVIGKTNSEREALEKKIARLESLNRTASKVKPSADPTVNALQEARRGHDEAMSMLIKDKEKALKELQDEKEEVVRLQDLREADYQASQRLKEQISVLEREKDAAKGEVSVAGKAAERSLREKEKEVLRWEKKFVKLEEELASVRKKVRSGEHVKWVSSLLPTPLPFLTLSLSLSLVAAGGDQVHEPSPGERQDQGGAGDDEGRRDAPGASQERPRIRGLDANGGRQIL